MANLITAYKSIKPKGKTAKVGAWSVHKLGAYGGSEFEVKLQKARDYFPIEGWL